ncbi:MAG: ChaN family lipoprotein [Pseudomonadota bacterium]
MRQISALGALLLFGACAQAPGNGPQFTQAALLQESHPLAGTIWDVGADLAIDQRTLARRLDQADIVILGEVHDNPRHHIRQADLVAALEPGGLAFEMVPEASEEGIAVFQAQGAEPGEIGPAIGWDRLGWPDWDLYAPIFEAAPDARITGGAVATSTLRRAMSEGAAAAFDGDAARYGLTIRPDAATQRVLEDEMIVAHCNKLPRDAAGRMAEAQRLRDARFANAVERARGSNDQAVLITGNGHARTDRGVPAYLARSNPDLLVAALGQVEVEAGANEPSAYGDLAYDYVWFSARVDRPDPCAAFN